MKKLITVLYFLLCISLNLVSQSPQAFNYQAIARDSEGEILANEQLDIKFEIRRGSINGSIDYAEYHNNTQTNNSGLFTLIIGEGTNATGSLSSINWGIDEYFLKVFMNNEEMGTSKLYSVPYSLQSENSEKINSNPVVGNPSLNEVLKWNGNQWEPQIDNTNPTGSAGGDLGSSYPDPIVTGIQNTSVSSTSPSTDQVLKYNGTHWEPQNDDTNPTGSAGGDLGDNYPNPTVVKIQNNPVSNITPSTNQVLKWDGINWSPAPDETGSSYNAGAGITISGTTISAQTTSPLWNANQLQGNSISLNTPSNNQVLKWDGSSWAPSADNIGGSLWSQSGSDIYYNSGKVMVGTTSSSGSLQFESYNTFNNGAAIGAYDYTNSSAAAVFGYSNSFAAIQGNGSNANWAGYFQGDVQVTGNLSKGGGSFKIDHPLDPENKYLYHSFVESPDMMNVYNGNIILDNNGEAVVYLPEWFSALNKDYRYQLTCIGGFAPVYVSEKISGNSFKIAGGSSGMEVSWQITGIRQDPYANQNRIPVEVEKPENEKGYYLHYEEYNQSIEKSIRVARHPKIMEELNSRKNIHH